MLSIYQAITKILYSRVRVGINIFQSKNVVPWLQRIVLNLHTEKCKITLKACFFTIFCAALGESPLANTAISPTQNITRISLSTVYSTYY